MAAVGGMFPSYNALNNKRALQSSCTATEKQLIDTLYNISQILFTEDFINTIFKIYECEEFNISNFALFQEISKCDMFMDFLKNDNEDKTKSFEKIFNIYFNCLAKNKININAIALKNKICTLLKMTIKIPSYKSGVSLKNINVNIATTYKPLDNNSITAACDIVNVIKESFFNSINTSNIESFTFTPHTSSVVIQGPLLKQIMVCVLNMQEQLLQSAKSYGVKIDPFIEKVNSKLTL